MATRYSQLKQVHLRVLGANPSIARLENVAILLNIEWLIKINNLHKILLLLNMV